MLEPRKILIGTSNLGRASDIQKALSDLPFEFVTPDELDLSIVVPETGDTPEANAQLKAVAYAEAASMPTVAIDSGLHINGLRDSEQPGVFVRRLTKDSELATDEAVIRHYTHLLMPLGETSAEWIMGMALSSPIKLMDSREVRAPTRISSTPCVARQPGLPINSLQLTAEGIHFAELDKVQYQELIAARYEPLHQFLSETLSGDPS